MTTVGAINSFVICPGRLFVPHNLFSWTHRNRNWHRRGKRIAELDRLFLKIYEDNANAKLSDERYAMMSATYENEQTEQELDDCHKQLIDVLGKPERKLVLRIIDGKDRLADEIGLDSFIFGFKLATQLAHELKKYDGHLRSEQTADEDVRRSILSEEEDQL